jgi:hypothetical protein
MTMRWVALAIVLMGAPVAGAAAPATRPATNPAAELEQRVLQAIYELDSPDVKVRDAAAEKLLALPPDRIEGKLRELLRDPPTPEFKSRAEFVLAEIPKRWLHVSKEGGRIEAGFQAVLTAKPAYAAGERVTLSVEIRAVGQGARQFTEVRGVDFQMGDDGPVLVSKHSDARVIIRRIGGGALPKEGKAVVYDLGKGNTIDFFNGGRVKTEVCVSDGVELGAGEYEVEFVYYAASKGLLAGAVEDLRSNRVRVKVGL